MSDHVNTPWRVGQKVGRTIYAQPGPNPTDHDPLIGVMDTPELAASAVEGHNFDLGCRIAESRDGRA